METTSNLSLLTYPAVMIYRLTNVAVMPPTDDDEDLAAGCGGRGVCGLCRAAPECGPGTV